MHLSPDQFEARGRALENVFFRNVDAKLLADLRNKLSQMEEANKLAHVSEIMDQKVLQDLVAVGVTAESLLAMRFVPMLKVAWCDREISPAEQAAVLKAAESENVQPGSPPHNLLRSWLERRPDDAVFVAWKEYIQVLTQRMPPESMTSLRERMASLCHRAAKAAGGVLGIGSISKTEQQTIDECLSTFDRKS